MPRSISEITGGGPTVLDRLGRPLIPIQQHRWSVEVRGDEVADITFAGVPLLRAIRPVIRDRDWNSVPARVVDVRRSGSGAALDLRFDDDEVKFDTTLTLTLTSTRLVVDLQGRALQACQTNRAGLVVLHDAGDAGTAVSVHHGDGSVEEVAGRSEISPHQPFRDVTGFSWSRDDVRRDIDAVRGRLRDRGPAQLDRRLVQDLRHSARPALSRLESGRLRVHQTVTVDVNDRRTPGPLARSDTRRDHRQRHDPGPVPPIEPRRRPPVRPAAVEPSKDTGYEAVLVELTGPEEPWSELLAAADGQASRPRRRARRQDRHRRPGVGRRWVAALPGFDDPDRRVRPDGHISTEPLWHALAAAAAASG